MKINFKKLCDYLSQQIPDFTLGDKLKAIYFNNGNFIYYGYHSKILFKWIWANEQKTKIYVTQLYYKKKPKWLISEKKHFTIDLEDEKDVLKNYVFH